MGTTSAQGAAVRLVVGIGDIHGRFHRLEGWLDALEQARGRRVDLALAVGDVEAFRLADDHRRKAAKRAMPAEFAEYADGVRRMPRPLAFIGGNNEDFETLHALPEGGPLAPGVDYLGRAGSRQLAGLHVAYLSGIYAPRFFEQPLALPVSRETRKQAGYFRRDEVERVRALRDVDVLLVHEWPRGLVGRAPAAPPPSAARGRPSSADGAREAAGGPAGAPGAPGAGMGAGMPSPWMGNAVTRGLVEAVRPQWLLCGHSHRAFAASLPLPGGGATRVACLDQAARPDGCLFWLEVEGRRTLRAGWGVSGEVCWEEGAPWDRSRAPEARPSEAG